MNYRQSTWLARGVTPRAAGFLAVLLVAGCSTSQYRKSADKEAYAAIQQRTPLVSNMDARFTIEQTNTVSLDELPKLDQVPDYLGEYAEAERGAAVLSLERALDLAVHQSRNYQNAKEQVYLAALSLTLARHQFAPLFSASGVGSIGGITEQGQTVEIDPFTGQPKVVFSDALVERQRVTTAGSVGVNWLIRDVGKVSAAFVADFSRFLSSDPRALTSSRLAATFSRPLLRNAGYKQDVENLTQSERNLLYSLRTFTRFRKDFTVRVASDYFAVLGARDAVRNTYHNFQNSRRTAEHTKAMAEEGRRSQADLGRIQQQELTAEGTWVANVRSYRQALDNFKIAIGLSTDARLVLDDHDLEQLKIEHPNLAPEDSVKVALAARLDLQNARDAVDDAGRKVKLAADSLKSQLDLVASTGIASRSDQSSGFPVPELDRYHWDAGVNFDLPLDRKAERNSYRSSLITQAQSARSLQQLEDEIKLQVRDAWRTLEQARRTYEISELGVKLAERRVEEQVLLAELGRAKAQDQVDTQNSLTESRNQRTQALVGHTIARLSFWNSLGILYIKDNGQWQEIPDAKSE